MFASHRLIIVGKSGNGKSSTCNTLVEEQRFKADACASAVSTVCQLEKNWPKNLTIVDTPGLCDSESSWKECALEIQRSVLDICKEPHAFLLIIRMGRITHDEKLSIDLLRIIFGQEVFEHGIVVLTHGCETCKKEMPTKAPNEMKDNHDELQSFCRKNKILSEIVDLCNNRVIRIENDVKKQCSIHTTKKMFVQLDKLVRSVSKNGRFVYSNHYISTHRKTLEDHMEKNDDLQEEIKVIQKALKENIEIAIKEEKERNKKARREEKERREIYEREEKERRGRYEREERDRWERHERKVEKVMEDMKKEYNESRKRYERILTERENSENSLVNVLVKPLCRGATIGAVSGIAGVAGAGAVGKAVAVGAGVGGPVGAAAGFVLAGAHVALAMLSKEKGD